MGAAAAAVPPQQLIPDSQRRSENVSTYPQELYNEMPDAFYPSAPGAVAADLQQNVHSPEYVQEALRTMQEGAQGNAVRAGMHPFLRSEAPAAFESSLAAQAGARALKQMMARRGMDGMPELMNTLVLHEDYDKAIGQAQALQQYPQLPY
jgi:hypothetical protein